MTQRTEHTARTVFAEVVAKWRTRRGFSQDHLAGLMGYHASYVSHMESARYRPTREFARRSEAVLAAGSEILHAFDHYRTTGGAAPGTPPATENFAPGPLLRATVMIEREEATLTYAEGAYTCRIERVLTNVGSQPVTTYPVRIDVDRFPDEPERSRRFYADRPLSLTRLRFAATLGHEPMDVAVTGVRDSYLKLALTFANPRARFPLYPGEQATLAYSYTVPEAQYGQWFEREIRVPTRHLTMSVDLPAALDPVVTAATHSYLGTLEERPIRTAAGEGRERYQIHRPHALLTSHTRISWHFP